MTEAAPKSKNPAWKALRILLILVIVVVVLATALAFGLRLAAPGLAVGIGNNLLPTFLGARFNIDGISLNLRHGQVGVEGVRLGQPHGFHELSAEPLLDLPAAHVHIQPGSLRGDGPIRIEEIRVTDARLNLVVNQIGLLNAAALGPGPVPPDEDEKSAPDDEATQEQEAANAKKGRPILLQRLVIENFAFSYLDQSVAKSEAKELFVSVEDIQFELKNIRLNPAAPEGTDMPGRLMLTARILQKDVPNALLGVAAHIATIGAGVPPVNAVVRLGGLETRTLRPVVPPGVGTALAGSNLDIRVDAAAAPEVLDCEAVVTTVGGRFRATVKGTPEEPKADIPEALSNVIGRVGGGVGNVADNVSKGAVGIGKTAAKSATTLAKGGLGVVGSIGKGLARSVKGAAKGDMKETVGGIGEATVGSAKQAGKTVKETGGQVASGVADAAGEVTGTADAAKWREAAPQRWETQWQEALEKLEQMPHPNSLRDASN